MSTSIAQAATDAGLAQEWPRESDSSAKEAQVGLPGGVAPERGGGPPYGNPVDREPDASAKESQVGKLGRVDARQVRWRY